MEDHVDATALAERVRRNEMHPSELVEAAIAAIERVNPRLNAVAHRMYYGALAAAKVSSPRPSRPADSSAA